MEITSKAAKKLTVDIARAYLNNDKAALLEYLCTPRWEDCDPEEKKFGYEWLIACCRVVNNH